MSKGTAESIPDVLPIQMVMDPQGIDGIPIEPENLPNSYLWYGIQGVTVPEDRLLTGGPDGVMIATTLRGRDMFVPVPPGVAIYAEGCDPKNDIRSQTGNPADNDGRFLYPPKYVTHDGKLALLEPDFDIGWENGPAVVAAREAARHDAKPLVYPELEEKTLRVNGGVPVLQGTTTIRIDGIRQDTQVSVERVHNADTPKLTASGQAELRKVLLEEPVEIAGKKSATVTAARLSVSQAVETPNLGALLAEVVAERQHQDDPVAGTRRPDVVMATAIKEGLTSGANSNGAALPKRIPLKVDSESAPVRAETQEKPKSPRFTWIAAGIAAVANAITPGSVFQRAGKHRSGSTGRHRLRPAS